MLKVLTALEMGEVDRSTTDQYNVPSLLLMENAAQSVFAVIENELGSIAGNSFLVLCGKGNNGGDGAAVSRLLWQQGGKVTVVLLGSVEDTSGDARVNFDAVRTLSRRSESRLEFLEGDAVDFEEFDKKLSDTDVVVDALLGTGVDRPLGGRYQEIVAMINVVETMTVSVDLPTGLYADDNEIKSECVDADYTVTFTAPKLANVAAPAVTRNGSLFVRQIGSPAALVCETPSKTFLAESADASAWLHTTRFRPGSYKSRRGSVVFAVGSKRYSGAAVLAGNASMFSGAGLVTVASPESAYEPISKRVLPEVMVRSVAETSSGTFSEESYSGIADLVAKSDAVAVGCGLGSDEEETRRFVRRLVRERSCPLVVDADGLNAIAPLGKQSVSPPLIITPHEGEFRRLIGETKISGTRIDVVREFAASMGVFLVLKGQQLLVGAPDGRVAIIPTGNPGVGKAGNGDNLTGLFTGFIAQAAQFEIGLFETLVAGSYISGLAADIAAEKFGMRTMVASDVRESLVDAIRLIGDGE